MVVGNWKMHGSSAALVELDGIAEAARHARVDVAVCLPATLLMAAAQRARDPIIGAQDCHAHASGSHTGDVSAAMIADAGARLTIIGHSERRRDHGETDAIVNAKLDTAIAHGLGVILCVGESEAQRREGDPAAFVCRQVAASLPAQARADRLMIAYEPLWAIGSGRSASGEQIATIHTDIRRAVQDRLGDQGADVPILYGGSVTGDNADAILGLETVDGVLVGGASLTAERLAPIIAAAARHSLSRLR
ncbi:triosephosphate isomerase [Hephaestia caeni]|uniref:Triosephosphate isomerase n=1 Tax=Hephaestia caeni TaxID=645617 RepID=A0A397P907_9SPHN|nr:triose-phosphate isomerase [Hephaestia caeni]RIA45542.1 triosephosphate isomerase [Hephaestia caeni]